MWLRMLEAIFITSHTKACVFNHNFLGTRSGKTLFLVHFLLGRKVSIMSRLYVMHRCFVHRYVFVHRYMF